MAVVSALLHFVRHGRAVAGWDDSLDPALDDRGRAQAEAVAARFAPTAPVELVSSPMRRCRETAAPLAARWGSVVRIEPDFGEIPSPLDVPVTARTGWLRGAMAGTWSELGERYIAFRDGVLDAARAQAERGSAVVFSHFVAINALLGAVLGDDRVLLRKLDNCSVTTIAAEHGVLRVVEHGTEADTLIR